MSGHHVNNITDDDSSVQDRLLPQRMLDSDGPSLVHFSHVSFHELYLMLNSLCLFCLLSCPLLRSFCEFE